MVEDLEPSRPFTVRVQCIISERCSQCVMSDTFTVPPGQSALYEKEALKKKGKKGRRTSIRESLHANISLSELTETPALVNMADAAAGKGRRTLLLTWKVTPMARKCCLSLGRRPAF